MYKEWGELAFCSNCGAKLEENVNFCSACGADCRQEPNTRKEFGSTIIDGHFTRMREMEEIQRMAFYFSPKQKEYKKRERLWSKIRLYSKKYPPAWFILFCVLLAWFAARYVLTAILCGHMDMLAVGLAAVCGLFIIGSLLEKFHLRCRSKKIEKMICSLNELEEELFTYYKGYGDCAVEFEYTDPQTLAQIYTMLNRGEANSIADAAKILSWSKSFS